MTGSQRINDTSPGFLKKLRWRAEVALFMGVTFVLAMIPVILIPLIGRFLGRLSYLLLGSRRRIALEGIRGALPILPAGSVPEQIAKSCFAHLGTSFIENCRLYHRSSNFLDRVVIDGLEHYEMAREKGKGVMFLTGHCGNWELSSLSFGLRHHPMVVMVREQKNPYLTRCIENIRSRYGNIIIHKKGALREILRVLRQDGVVGVLIDQAVMPSEGYQVDFLGRPAWTTSMPVQMARKTGAAILPGFISREGNMHRLVLYPEVVFQSNEMTDEALARDTAILTGYVEDFVKAHPDQWYWVHRRWKERSTSALQTTDFRYGAVA